MKTDIERTPDHTDISATGEPAALLLRQQRVRDRAAQQVNLLLESTSGRERQVIELAAAAELLTNEEIGKRLGMAKRTVKIKWNRIFSRKLGVSSKDHVQILGQILDCEPNPKWALRGKKFTFKEFEVLKLVAEGKNSTEVSQQLGITGHVVKNYIRELCDKIGVDSQVLLAVTYMVYIKPALENKSITRDMIVVSGLSQEARQRVEAEREEKRAKSRDQWLARKKELTERKNEVRALADQGASIQDISKRLGIGKNAVADDFEKIKRDKRIESRIKSKDDRSRLSQDWALAKTILEPGERKVANLIAQGKSGPEMVAELNISLNTVKRFLGLVYYTTGLSNRKELTALINGKQNSAPSKQMPKADKAMVPIRPLAELEEYSMAELTT